MTETALTAEASGELAALLFSSDGGHVTAIRNDSQVVLSFNGSIVNRERVDLCSCCLCGSRFAFAFSNGLIELFDMTPTLPPTVVTSLQIGIIRGAMGWDGERLLFMMESGELRAWDPSWSSSVTVPSDEMLPAALHVIPGTWLLDERRMLLI